MSTAVKSRTSAALRLFADRLEYHQFVLDGRDSHATMRHVAALLKSEADALDHPESHDPSFFYLHFRVCDAVLDRGLDVKCGFVGDMYGARWRCPACATTHQD
jgi:hypothetical protein